MASDDLFTVADLMARTDFDRCSKCGGYAMRRLSDTQLSYYRAAHQLHGIKQRLGIPDTDTSAVINRLEELVAWSPVDEEQWCGSDSWQWQDIIRELRRKVSRYGIDGVSMR
ncbi:hypothetical protein ACFWNF_00030 [Streptomyces anulatus]|uniref:hypothetical protein n=1 Tax=Streptomyces anulatus TaxID=1892 RepID=UPI00364D34CF